MAIITIELTDTEYKSLEYVASPQDWADNALKNRARIAIDEIIASLIVHCNENEIALAVGREAQIQQAFDLEIVKTAAQRNAEAQAALEAMETP